MSRPKSFADVVDAVRKSWKGSGNSTVSAQQVAAPQSRWQTAPWQGNSFPTLEASQLEVLWPDETDADTRRCVEKALEDMKLNWDLDSQLLGQRSDASQGSAAIVALLSRLTAAAKSEAGQAVRKEGDEAATIAEPSSEQSAVRTAAGTSDARLAKSYERHDLLRAIERQDTTTILEIRNFNFDLLLDSAPGSSSAASPHGMSKSTLMQTPLGYAISLGPKWESTAIVLVGAMSKFVNTLPDPVDDGTTGRHRVRNICDPRTLARLRKLRANLKLAIDSSLATDQTRLLSSYVQVLFMSEGLAFITDAIDSLCSTIRSKRGDPVDEATQLVLQFVNAGLTTSQGTSKRRSVSSRIASVQDLINNAVGDLLLMALWELIRPRNDDDNEDFQALPAYFFARDDRVTTVFRQRLDTLERRSNATSTSYEWRRALQVKEQIEGKGARRLESSERLEAISNVLCGRS